MGLAIAKSLVEKREKIVSKLIICERDESKWKNFLDLKTEVVSAPNEKEINKNDIIIIAVKPQDFENLSKKIGNFVSGKIIISIVAGITLEKMKKHLKNAKIIRVMPNTPSLIGEGISGWIADKEVKKNEKEIVKNILSCFGDEVEFEKEDEINVVTAISGSGPAYVFYILKNIIDSAEKLGLTREKAKKLAIKTFIGSAKLAEISIDELEDLQKKVMSKGGTTEQAIKIFEEKGLGKILQEGIEKAYLKAKELGK